MYSVTLDLLRDVAKNGQSLLQPKLKVLRDRDLSELAVAGDLTTRTTPERRMKIRKASSQPVTTDSSTEEAIDKNSTMATIIANLLEHGIEPEVAVKVAQTTIALFGHDAPIALLKRESMREAFNREGTSAKIKKTVSKNGPRVEAVLPDVLAKATKNGITAHEALKKEGWVKDIPEDIQNSGVPAHSIP